MKAEVLDRLKRGHGPWAGGTWGGQCGSVTWIEAPADDGDELVYVQRYTSQANVRTAQAQHRNGLLDAGGFPVECHKPRRHEGDCWAGPFTWETPPVEVCK